MQSRVDTIIAKINKHITDTNKNTGVSTPHCHTAILKRHGSGKKRYFKSDWERLYDGVHGDTETKIKWAGSLSAAIRHNRGLIKRKHTHSSDNEFHSPKRSWRGERKVIIK